MYFFDEIQSSVRTEALSKFIRNLKISWRMFFLLRCESLYRFCDKFTVMRLFLGISHELNTLPPTAKPIAARIHILCAKASCIFYSYKMYHFYFKFNEQILFTCFLGTSIRYKTNHSQLCESSV